MTSENDEGPGASARNATVSWNRANADTWRAAGWQTVNVDYRGCAQSIGDVLWFMQRIRQLRPNAVMCATGESAGAHLALMLASLRPDLACAIAKSGPSDLAALDGQRTYDATTQTFTTTGASKLFHAAVAAFGAKNSVLPFSSPSRYARNVAARLLLASGVSDPLVPLAQNANFGTAVRAAHPGAYVDVIAMPNGRVGFVHSGVTQASLADLSAREDALVAPLVTNVRRHGSARGDRRRTRNGPGRRRQSL